MALMRALIAVSELCAGGYGHHALGHLLVGQLPTEQVFTLGAGETGLGKPPHLHTHHYIHLTEATKDILN